MGVEKSQLKMLVANDIGADIEDRLEGERRTQYELNGAAAGLKQASKKVPNDLIAHLKKDEDEGLIKDGMEVHLVVQLVKKYLTKAGDFLSHLGDVEQQKAITQAGRADGLESAMEMVRKVRQAEATKLQRFIALAQEADDVSTDGAEGTPEVPRTPAEAARAEHGSVAERRAAAQETPVAEKQKKQKKKRRSKA